MRVPVPFMFRASNVLELSYVIGNDGIYGNMWEFAGLLESLRDWLEGYRNVCCFDPVAKELQENSWKTVKARPRM